VKLPSSIPSKEQVQLIDTLQSLELGIWVTVILLLAILALMLYAISSGKKNTSNNVTSDWQQLVESNFNKGKCKEAIQTLKVLEIQFPKNAAIKWWYGRCCFLEEDWKMATQKFEECLRLDPYFRKSVNDYMSFIELNNLVVGVNGYLCANEIQS
jgi:outer membrane protein assembly factor BamD (BamD/ComL family)